MIQIAGTLEPIHLSCFFSYLPLYWFSCTLHRLLNLCLPPFNQDLNCWGRKIKTSSSYFPTKKHAALSTKFCLALSESLSLTLCFEFCWKLLHGFLYVVTWICQNWYIDCVTRAPLSYFIRSWVALSFKVVSQSVSLSGMRDTLPDLHFVQYIKA